LKRLRANLRRWSLGVELVEADVTTWTPPQPLDAVLLDAPCSATGTMRRHPDVAHLKRPRDVLAMAEIQDRLLAAAARMLRPGGRLVYSVCSLQAEEGAARIGAALRCGDWQLDPLTEAEVADLPEARTSEGYLRTHPALWQDKGGMDGFFAARLVKVS
ncbi:MAG: hypothetical protein ACRDOE_21140, partial [Streptosporangiaceae bacterium]